MTVLQTLTYSAAGFCNDAKRIGSSGNRDMREHFSEQTQNQSGAASLPPCCGTGCAVCVLDYADEYITTYQAPEPLRHKTLNETAPVTAPISERTQCCNTGCLICVRDYPELFLQPEAETHTLQLLEAVERAQLQAAQLCEQQAGERQ